MKSFSNFLKESYESTHPINYQDTSYQGVSDVQTVIGGSENTIKLFAYIIEVCNNMKKQKKFQEQIELNWSKEIAIGDLTEEESDFFGIISPDGKIYQTSGSSRHRMAICELEDDFEASPEKILKYIKLYFIRGGDLDIRGTKEMISKHMDILKRIANNLGTRLNSLIDESKSLIPLALITALGLTMADLKTVDAAKNNPGNIRKSSIKWDGLSDEQTDKNFAEFKSIEYGIRALAKNLKTYRVNYDLNTIEGIINRWAPPSENPTAKYIKNVSTWMNVKADEPLDIFDTAGNLENRERLKLLIKAIIRQETGKTIDDKLVDKGIDLL